MEHVTAVYGYEYTAKDGRLVSIRPGESFVLLSRTNQHWWHVRRDQRSRPFYVPAQYVQELSAADSSGEGPDAKPRSGTENCRLSSFGSSENTRRSSSFGHSLDVTHTHMETRSRSFSAHGEDLQLYTKPKLNPEVRRSGEPWQDGPGEPSEPGGDVEDWDFPPPPPDAFDDIPEISVTQFDTESSDSLDSVNQSASKLPSLSAAADPDGTEQGKNESLQSAVYVNVAQLRQSISESPPQSTSCPDPEGWEVHVDQESGQEYYYHPASGRTTWDNPFLDSPAEPEPAEDPCSPPQSPALSQSTASPSAWTSDWEQLVDATSGLPYFYNPMSGETSWEPPEQPSPYTPQMEPMSVHRFHEDGPPPLPEEDYPPEDYPTAEPPEAFEELVATGPPTLPKEYTFSHVGRTIIPRASLDRSAPAGWTCNVEPSGMWVYTSENSPDQWIKSLDERGKTYYYLRDGSRSQWSLPEVPVSPGQLREENGVEPESPSIFKNWRHSVGPVQLGSAQDDGRFVPTHRRNTSDYSSDSSSTGNSPETQHNVQNLEKAGILNKTKVCENGKKVRKNWTQTWTVLHGGILTFHKDPKSTQTGALNKTNQIVAEVAVDLRGATIGWASKDKSSKKNVLELKGKNGVEFLIQYDTESIISDWFKVLVDTIRQLEYQDQHHSEDEDTDLYEKVGSLEREDKLGSGLDARRRASRPSVVSMASTSVGETDPKRVRTKLMKFLMKRPTLQSVKEKGYIRDNVFGCKLDTLCSLERSTVPSFVEKCIRAVEKRGLDIDGLYRVSGNLAVIQKLRFKADHEELDLEDGQWEDVHVITGALKLFFRELQEPLFPYSHFNRFIGAIKCPDYNTKLSQIDELVRSLPPCNHDTMKLLFGHLYRLIKCGDNNRMTAQNVAIVFGPTLLRPETESNNLAMHMVYQNQIVEFILREYEHIFNSS